MPSEPISVNELRNAFISIKTNKCHKYLFNLSLKKSMILGNFKIAKVTPLFKVGDNTELSNYRPISSLPCFSKILERVMHNRLNKYLLDSIILYKKQFGFQEGHSTDHTILQLVDKI